MEMMDIFNVFCGVCSIVGLLVSLFTAGTVIKVSQNINYIDNRKKSTNKVAVHKSKVHGDVVGGDKN